MGRGRAGDWRRRVEKRLRDRSLTHTLSLARLNLRAQMATIVPAYVKGRVLEVGAGLSPYRDLLANSAESITTLDVEDRAGDLDILADVQDMPEVPAESFETVICNQVLEHVPSPQQAVAEMSRVLVTGGHAIITVPHLSAIHEAPDDYYRYTRYSLQAMAHDAGLTPVLLEETGGWVSFLVHGASVALLTVAAPVPGLFWPVWAVNYALFVRGARLVDRAVGMRSRYPCDYVLVAVKDGVV